MSARPGVVHVLGSLNVDHPVQVSRHPRVGETVEGRVLPRTPGGKGLNCAVAAARAAGPDGPPVHLAGAVGDDGAGRWLCDVARAEGVDVGAVTVDRRRPTGSAHVVVADGGANTVIVDPGANGAVAPAPEAMRFAAGDVAVAQLEVPGPAVGALFAAARAAGARTVLNPSPVGAGPPPIGGADVVVVNQHELAAWAGADPVGDGRPDPRSVERMADALGRADGRTILCTSGAAGVVIADRSGVRTVEGIAVDAVDTTGAGDCFLGVLAVSLAAGAVLDVAVRRANVAAARSVTRRGAMAAMPTADEIDR